MKSLEHVVSIDIKVYKHSVQLDIRAMFLFLNLWIFFETFWKKFHGKLEPSQDIKVHSLRRGILSILQNIPICKYSLSRWSY